MAVKPLLVSLRAMDAVGLLALLLVSLTNLLFSAQVPQWGLLVLLNLVIAVLLLLLISSAAKSDAPLLTFLRDWYPVAMTLILFKELYLMVHPINPHDFDALFIAIDRWIFGVDPTRWLERWTHPLLTELMQFSYSMFYFLFLIAAGEYYKKNRMEEFRYAMFLIPYGFYLSYAFYFIFPAVGPRFSLHDFSMMDTDLPGVFLTDVLREFLNSAESIPRNALNPVDFAQRDVFPSGHTQLTLVVMFLAYRSRLKSRHFILTIGVLLIISTVYLRYHYVIDVIAGVLFMLITVWTGPYLYRWWNRKREEWRQAIGR
ncbi:MAG: phosphatase PAP2 family protein [Bacteroidota bacterium]